MPRSSGRLDVFRRLALVFATAQGLLYAALPFAEARLEKPPAQAGIESHHSHDCVPLHQPDKCVFCQLATLRAGKTDPMSVRAEGRTVAVRASGREVREPERRVHRPTRSRAPPASLA
ncbi:MAG: hypothetical protein HYR48_01640 [Gemmatimonadetes bacterium]|nr:hypothetical protein [Gemmatimonadota bacterium]